MYTQSVLNAAGGQGKTTVFLITDTQIKDEAFLEDIDSLLNTGEVPNLFASDEKAEIMEVRQFFSSKVLAKNSTSKLFTQTFLPINYLLLFINLNCSLP